MHFPDLLGYIRLIIITKHVGRLNRRLLPSLLSSSIPKNNSVGCETKKFVF